MYTLRNPPPILCGDGMQYREKLYAFFDKHKYFPFKVNEDERHCDVGIIEEFGRNQFLSFQIYLDSIYHNLEEGEEFDGSSCDSLAVSHDEVRFWLNKYNFYYKFVRVHDKDDALTFGKYTGQTVEQVVSEDFNYFQFCLREADRFFCKGKYLIELSNSGYEFDKPTIEGYARKEIERRSYDEFMKLWNYVMEASTPSNPNYGNEDDNDDRYSDVDNNSHYNDNLDMDQQSQEYWDSL